MQKYILDFSYEVRHMIFFVFYETLDHMQLKHLIYYKFMPKTYALTMPKITKHEKHMSTIIG
jgi:hypothetical protein